MKFTHLDLFSGIGGISLGLERTGGFETIAFCEPEPFCQKVLKKHWAHVPIYNDVNTITEEFDGSAFIISGGFPCQPYSTAGQQRGSEDDRDLWDQMFNCIKKYKPTWVLGENVTGIINMALDRVLSDLESEGYSCRAFVIPACSLNAKHRRDRVWIMGYSEHDGSSSATESRITGQTSAGTQERQKETVQSKGTGRRKDDAPLAHTPSGGQQGQGSSGTASDSKKNKAEQTIESVASRIRGIWAAEPELGRVAYGIPDRVDRLTALGNAVVPQIPEIIGHAILEAEKDRVNINKNG